MRREGVPEPVGVRDEAAQGGRAQRPPVDREEDVVVGALRELGPPVLEVDAQAVRGLLSERHGALLAALAADEQRLLLEVDGGEREVDRLLRPQPGRVKELEEGTVSQSERVVAVQGVQEVVGLLGTRCVGRRRPRRPVSETCGTPRAPARSE
jgi:hypothetical protein